MTRNAFLSFMIKIITKAGFLVRERNLHPRRFLRWMRRDSPLSLCKLHKLKLNLESFGHLTQESALLSIGTRTLSVLADWHDCIMKSRFRWSIDIQVERSTKLDWKLNIGHARCKRNKRFRSKWKKWREYGEKTRSYEKSRSLNF